MSRVNGVICVCLALTVMNCGQFGRKVASDAGGAITPDSPFPIRDTAKIWRVASTRLVASSSIPVLFGGNGDS
ncbi:MAG: hypothetical protein ABI625_27240 [bacterium]